MSRPEGRRAVLEAFVISRALLLAITLLAAAVRRISPLDIWNQWDAQWYIGIATHGYAWSLHGKSSLAFFPLYPLAVHVVALSGMPALAAALLLSNAAFGAALAYTYRLFIDHGSADVARRAVLLLALFPTAFFSFAPYTESLFLLAATGAIYHATRRQALRAGIWLAIGLMTRSTGLILILPVLVLLHPRTARSAVQSLAPGMIAVGLYGGWYLRSQHVAVSAMWTAQRGWHRSLAPPWQGFSSSFDWLVRHATDNVPWAAENILEIVAVLLVLVLTACAWKALGHAFRLYVTAFWALVLCTPEWLDGYYAPFSSVDRFVLVLFPVAAWTASRLSWPAFRVTVWSSAALMTLATDVFLAGGWVG